MGIFGTYGAFQGLGKPSIKLEFEDNESLVNFSKRMQEGEAAPVVADPDLANFKKLKATKGGELEGTTTDEETRKYDFYLMLMSDVEPINAQKFTPQILSDYDRDHNDFKVNTPIGEVIIKRELIFGKDEHLLKHIFPYFNVLKRTLEDPTCIFHSKDGKGFKNKTFAKCFYLDGIRLLSIVSPVKPDTLELKTTYPTDKKRRYLNNYDEVWELVKRGGEKIIYSKPSINDLHGLGNPQILKSSFKIVEFRLPITITENGAKSFVDGAKNSLDGYGDFYTVRDMRKRSRKEPGDVATNKNLQFTKDNDRKINNFDRSLYELTNGVNSWNYGEKLKDTHWRTLTVKYNSDNGKYFTTIQLFFPYTLRRDLDKPTFTGYAGDVDVDVDLNNLYNYSYYVDSRNYVDRQKLEGFVKDDYYKTLLIEAIKSGYKQLQQRLINTKNSRLANTPSNIAEAERLIKYYKMLYSDPSKYDLLDKAYGGGFKNISNKLEKFLGEGGLALDGLGAPGDTFLVTDTRKKPRKELDDVRTFAKYDIRKLTGEELAKMQKEDPLLYEQIKSDINEAKVTPIKDASKDADELVAVWSKKFRPVRGFDEQKSIAPAREMKVVRDEITQYLVDEVNAGNYEYVRKLANLLGYKYIHNARIAETHSVIEQFATITPTLPEGWQISSAVPKYLPKLPKGFVYIDNGKDGFEYRHKIMPAKKGLGRTANPAIYNNNDIMECRGLVPTYTILDDYSSFFEQAKTHTEFAGFGLDDTLKLITDICRKHWKDCAKIAQHLKGDCKLQSAFNLWHWMRYNIRYEYDREGREEVRTPLRVWADRMRGVDCDCLSVFAYCVLKCMGYNPAFELVAFRNKPQYSHIFINLDGIVVDRVWFIFNSRPPMVTKSTIYRINDINDLGKLF